MTSIVLLAAVVPLLLCASAVAVAPARPSVREAAPMGVARAGHQATRLQDGTVLFTGGCAAEGCAAVQHSAEVYDPQRGRYAAVAGMREPRVSHTATRLPDGRVLVAGGWTGSATTRSAELYDPATRQFQAAPGLTVPRMDATATLLPSGGVLIVGGASQTNAPTDVAELFHPARRIVEPAGTLRTARVHHAAARLPDGRVLVVGGLVSRGQATATAEVYDPETGVFSPAGPLGQPRCKHAALPLADGRVMVLAGSSDCDDRRRLATTEVFDPATGTFSPGPALADARYKVAGAAAVLDDGTVVIAGDAHDVEYWRPGMASFAQAEGPVGARLAFSSATPLAGNQLLVAGGYDDRITPTARAWHLSAPSAPER